MPSYEDGRILENLARIAILHKVDSNEFFDRIIEVTFHTVSFGFKSRRT
jgi:hypothetical protein